jgi:hypothetical protein
MTASEITVFTPYPFEIGQKIRIAGGPRGGDWQVIGLTERKIQLRCPVSGREVEWDRFCYLSDSRQQEWPLTD